MDESESIMKLEASKELIVEVKDFINKIDGNIGELASRTGFILTISSLISITTLGINNEAFMKYYLSWIFPYLIISLLILFYSSYSRKYIHIHDTPAVKGNLRAELECRLMVLDWLKEIYDKYRKNFKLLNKLFGLSLTFTLMFILSFIINFYLFNFDKLFNLKESIIFNFILFIFGSLIFMYVYFIKPKTVTKQSNIKR